MRIQCRGCIAAVLAAPLLAGLSAQAAAQSPNSDPTKTPQLNRAYAGCILNGDQGATVDNLLADLAASGIPDPSSGSREIAFVVVYALNNDNDGQPVTTVSGTSGFTGPVICRNDEIAGIGHTTQTSQIPASGTGASTVDVLDVEDVFILRYKLNNGSQPPTNEKVICHTVDTNTDCFRISPLLLP